MNYLHLWSDMHSNIHHNQMNQLMDWYRHAKKIMDFWPIAYYPFGIRFTETLQLFFRKFIPFGRGLSISIFAVYPLY